MTVGFLPPRTAVLLAAAALFPALARADDATIDRLLASQCAQCHGTNGKAVGEMESLAGESYAELLDELREMKADLDPRDIMHRQAAGYTDDQLARIARYFASLPGGDVNEREGKSEGDDD